MDLELSHDELRGMLEYEASVINNKDFITDDPVQFPRMFDDPRDIEIASILCATIAWGNRKMICRDCSRMLAMMGHQPLRYMMEEGYMDLNPEGNIHRTFFNRNLAHFLKGLRYIYKNFGSLQDFARSIGIQSSEYPAWLLVDSINRILSDENNGTQDSRCLPLNTANSALKRINMALRWLVRNDGIVDLGIWDVLNPSQLFIPLDVHVGNISRQLGLLSRKANDRKSCIDLTLTLRKFDPDDPVKFDYALFGIGIHHKLG